MNSRREFIKKAAYLSGGAGFMGSLPPSIQKAFALDPAPGSTYLDAEHIVLLMQENRSFDHCYGTLQGVRGFNDPRAISLPNKNKVWIQTDQAGESYAPFRLNIKESKATWLGSLPHSWPNMIDARNEGHNDRWLDAKRSGRDDCKTIPLTMGYYNREDIPFYYALADAFTVCDQHFCSSLTGTTPNRSYFWSGTIRGAEDADLKANVFNSDIDYGNEKTWKTFPEYLQENDISWKIYQNEISVPSGFAGEEDDWLANFTDNPMEWFSQYRVRFSRTHRAWMKKLTETLPQELAQHEAQLVNLSGKEKEELQRTIERKKRWLTEARSVQEKYTDQAWEQLTPAQQQLHLRAFTSNSGDPNYRRLEEVSYKEGDIERKMQLPKGDILHQFREDVRGNKLPTVSWLVAPSNFSDHPGSPWYGAWYVSEVLDILTSNPELWKKTIFVLNYDENDGYFDHIPPFTAPDPYRPESGKVSAGINAAAEYVNKNQAWMKQKKAEDSDREGPIGMGFRVPMVIASPWSRGGYVNSEVCDLTSPIQFMEHWLNARFKKQIDVKEISSWRRAVSGNLASVFRPYNGERMELPKPVDKDSFFASIHQAQFRELPTGYKLLSAADMALINSSSKQASPMPAQEKGTRPACASPYELYADFSTNAAGELQLTMQAGNTFFGKSAAGAPFQVHNTGHYKGQLTPPRAYAVKPGDKLSDNWQLAAFDQDGYELRVYGPNGFYRAIAGKKLLPSVQVSTLYEVKGKKPTGNLVLHISNPGKEAAIVVMRDNAYDNPLRELVCAPGLTKHRVELGRQHGWYDFTLLQQDAQPVSWQYAGHVDTGKTSRTDPQMA